jgi:hypothetical protein
MKSIGLFVLIVVLFSCSKENDTPKNALKQSVPFTCDGETYYVKMSDKNLFQRNNYLTDNGTDIFSICTFNDRRLFKINLKTLETVSVNDISLVPYQCVLNKDFKWWIVQQSDDEQRINVSLMDTLGNVSQKTKTIECLGHNIRIAPTNDNGFIMAITEEKKLSDNSYMRTGVIEVLLYDKNAQLVWDKTIMGIDGANVIEVTGGFLIGGQAYYQQNLFEFKPLLVKLDKNGNQIWQKTILGSDSTNHFYSVFNFRELPSKDYIITVAGAENTTTILKTDSAGNIIWKTDPIFSNEMSFVCLPDNNVVISYSTKNPANQNTLDVCISELGSDGTVKWKEQYGGTGDEFPNKLFYEPSVGYTIICQANMYSGKGSFHSKTYFNEYQTYDYIIKTDLQGKCCR